METAAKMFVRARTVARVIVSQDSVNVLQDLPDCRAIKCVLKADGDLAARTNAAVPTEPTAIQPPESANVILDTWELRVSRAVHLGNTD